MEEAWELEKAFWEAGTRGEVPAYYARVLASDAFVVVPDRVLAREDLLKQWDGRSPWDEYRLSDRRIVLVNGETVVLSYRIRAHSADTGQYCAQVSSVYTWVGGWALAFRQYTPDSVDQPIPQML